MVRGPSGSARSTSSTYNESASGCFQALSTRPTLISSASTSTAAAAAGDASAVGGDADDDDTGSGDCSEVSTDVVGEDEEEAMEVRMDRDEIAAALDEDRSSRWHLSTRKRDDGSAKDLLVVDEFEQHVRGGGEGGKEKEAKDEEEVAIAAMAVIALALPITARVPAANAIAFLGPRFPLSVSPCVSRLLDKVSFSDYKTFVFISTLVSVFKLW